MIAVDTNVLVHAHRSDSEFHENAKATIRKLCEGSAPWAIPWPCMHEFLAIVTHSRVFAPPTPTKQALAQCRTWAGAPSQRFIGELPGHLPVLEKAVTAARVRGPKVHDARIAALCTTHGVTELLTADRDFSRFARLTTRNPLVD